MQRKPRVRLMLALAAAAAVLIAGVVTYIDDTLRYKIADSFSRLGESLELTEAEPVTVKYSVAELMNDPRVSADQSMMLINTEYPLDADFTADLGEYKNTGVILNSCMLKSFEDLSSEVIDRFDETLYVSSAFRTAEEQAEQIAEEGALAQQVGASEHQAGLGVDVYVMYYAGEAFLKHEAGKWVNESCGRYGFIIRYPYYGEDETGIGYEPWHLRYVGLPHSEIIMKNSMTLEGYIGALEPGKFYSCKVGGSNWLVSRQSGDTLEVPEVYESAVISDDNTGGYVLTFMIK